MKLEQERQKQVYYSGIIQLIEDKEFPYLSCNVCGYDCYISGMNIKKKSNIVIKISPECLLTY